MFLLTEKKYFMRRLSMLRNCIINKLPLKNLAVLFLTLH